MVVVAAGGVNVAAAVLAGVVDVGAVAIVIV